MAAVAWPTGEDTIDWARNQAIGDDGLDASIMDDLTEAVTDVILASLDLDTLPDGAPVGTTCPKAVKQAIIMRALSLYARRDSPTGIVSFSPDAVFRVSRFDGDADALLAPYMPAMVG